MTACERAKTHPTLGPCDADGTVWVCVAASYMSPSTAEAEVQRVARIHSEDGCNVSVLRGASGSEVRAERLWCQACIELVANEETT